MEVKENAENYLKWVPVLFFFFGSWVLISLKHVAVKSVDFCCGSLTIEKNQYPSGQLSN